MSLVLNRTESHTRRMGRPARTFADKQLMIDMGKRLKWVRHAKGMTQRQIAEFVGLDQTTWSAYERGIRFPDQLGAVRLLAKLKISRDYLMDGVLRGVEADLAIRLALAHPNQLRPNDTDESTGIPRAS